jgi:ubiquinol-cytochrome c reductase cytochrome c subunit
MRRAALVGLALLMLALPAGTSAQEPKTSIEFPPGVPLVRQGFYLYSQNCASCHGDRGEGVVPPDIQEAPGPSTAMGPALAGVGAGAADFYLRTGYMPLEKAGDQPTRNPNFFDDFYLRTGYMPLPHLGLQPRRSRVLFTEPQLRALIAYVASLGPGLPIPDPHPENGDPSEGLALFREHCAGCHQIVAQGGYVTGAIPPPLGRSTPVQIAEAVRIGPFVMPRFSEKRISDSELDSLIAYVQYAKSPNDAGGWSIGHVGPVPEGMVTWFLAATVLVGTCVLIGKRLRR